MMKRAVKPSNLLPLRSLMSTFARPDDIFVSRLTAAVTEVSQNDDVRNRHGDDESHHPAIPPDVVCWASSNEEVEAVVRLCAEARVPLIPFGAGTSLEGHISALHGGVSLDLSLMNAIISEHHSDMDCRVQAGITRLTLNDSLRHSGLHFPIDPGADATLGGMAACGASGTAAVKYGTMKENILGMSVVLPNGETMTTGGRSRKSSAGYDLTRLMVGSEGTLGVITELQLRLRAHPTAVRAGAIAFKDLHSAASASVALLQMGIPMARCELLDATTIVAFNSFNGEVDNLPEVPHLFVEFEGLSDSDVTQQTELAAEVLTDCGGERIRFAADEDERRRLWKARHSTYYAALALRPGSRGIVTDACVPLSELADIMFATAADMEELGVIGPMLGHAGDGNFHCILLVKDDDPPEYTEALRQVNHRLIERTLSVGGTCTGEHGVGHGKARYLIDQFGVHGVGAMKAIKNALDPLGIMNPGKVIPIFGP